MPSNRSHDLLPSLLEAKLAKRFGTRLKTGAGEGEREGLFDRIRATMSVKALRQNYEAIQAQVSRQAMIPMIKANGYGHGAKWLARELVQLPNLYGLGVATLEEAHEVREAITMRQRKTKVIAFSGAIPWTEEKGRFCEQHQITPVIASDADWHAFVKQGWPAKIPYELKFNTGLNRLGLSLNLAPSVVKTIKHRKAEEYPGGVLSHLAIGENPDDQVSRSQREKFAWLRTEFSSLPATHFHLANSSAIWSQKQWGLDGLTDAVRPGISLYGVPPWKGAPERGLQAVMTLEALVIHTQKLKPGDCMGYGADFRVKGTQTVHAAVLSAGYADGVSRLLGGRGNAYLQGKTRRFLGRVSMDLSAIEADPDVKPGDWAQILGPQVDVWAQAQAAETIPYELLTSVSNRVQRKYE